MSFYFATFLPLVSARRASHQSTRLPPLSQCRSSPTKTSSTTPRSSRSSTSLRTCPSSSVRAPGRGAVGSLSYPRQRARREIEAAAAAAGNDARLIDLDSSDQAPHEKISPVFKVSASAGEEWAATCLVTTNKLLDKVPKPPPENSMLTSSKIWLSMIDRTHSVGLLRGSTGLNAIKEWADPATTTQRSALSQSSCRSQTT